MTAITLGHLRDPLHAGCAAAVARVLDAHEVEVDFVDVTARELPDMLAAGEIDLLVSAWLPRDEALLRPGLRAIGELYLPVYSWAATAPLGPVASLGRDDVAEIVTLPEEEQRLRAALAHLPGLADVPVRLVADEALWDDVAAKAADAPRLLMLAQPHALFHGDLLHVLEDPQGLLGGEMRARMLVLDKVAACADPDMIDELSEMMLGNRVMSALDYAIRVEGAEPEDAAESWQRGRLIPR
ncbi:glycine betaine ABC transporter substrate-binding protein [Acidomonas methanolica]|uniref:glycine betaine ABC transporter substrate-binding protein n=1 Tax=Acidomonas methanolica TaxID=437 RepID=UPI002119E077|nr:glycine betaine ABC transporter substrate-binding protein [Acidomonas methanolica]MCQ9155524.1 hypothetical protein [Acidomonas methanolica]